MIYENYHFWGMDLTWWLVWSFLLIWIFATQFNIPFQRAKRDTALDTLKKRFASGQINKQEFGEMQKVVES